MYGPRSVGGRVVHHAGSPRGQGTCRIAFRRPDAAAWRPAKTIFHRFKGWSRGADAGAAIVSTADDWPPNCREVFMGEARYAEMILSLVTTAERAAATIGDL